MQRAKKVLVLLVTMAVSCAFASYLVRQTQPAGAATATARLPDEQAQMLRAANRRVIGKTDAPYTLVEFMDYECPPCRSTAQRVEAGLASHPGAFRLSVHHLPLQMHPHAYEAAVVAEAAANQAGIDKVHSRLLNSKLGSQPASNFVADLVPNKARFAQDKTKARQNVEADLRLAETLGVSATPTFFVCYPDGSVYRASDIAKALADRERPL